MSTIDKNRKLLTLINVFTVAPDDQAKLVSMLIEATENTMKHLPGFVSANIHRSFDGKRVVNYAQWESMEHFQAMRADPRAVPHMEKIASFTQFDPILCEVIDTMSV
jgi:heme-degrading monooxygenase HmoA